MVKPQFELGRERVGRGVVRDLGDRREAILAVAERRRASSACRCAASPPPGLPGPKGNRETFVWCGGDGPRGRGPRGGDSRRRGGGRVKTAALITHSHPPAATEAVGDRRRASPARPAGAWSRTADELAKHGDAAAGVEVAERRAASRPLPGARRRRLDPARAAPLRPHRRAGLRRQLRHRRLPRRGRARRGRGGDPPRAGRRDRDGRAARAGGRRSRAPPASASTTSPSPAARTTASPS